MQWISQIWLWWLCLQGNRDRAREAEGFIKGCGVDDGSHYSQPSICEQFGVVKLQSSFGHHVCVGNKFSVWSIFLAQFLFILAFSVHYLYLVCDCASILRIWGMSACKLAVGVSMHCCMCVCICAFRLQMTFLSLRGSMRVIQRRSELIKNEIRSDQIKSDQIRSRSVLKITGPQSKDVRCWIAGPWWDHQSCLHDVSAFRMQ